MKVKVENLGIISSAEIDLSSKITLLCGPNNTGKTYLSYVLYALLKSKRVLIKESDQFTSLLAPLFTEEKSVSIELPVEDVFAKKKELAAQVKLELDSVFGISENEKKAFFSKTEIAFSLSLDDTKKHLLSTSFSGKLKLEGLEIVIEKKQGSLDVALSILSESVSTESATRTNIPRISAFLYTFLVLKSATTPIEGVVMFPVERNSIYTFNKELSLTRNELIDRIQAFGKGETIDPFTFVNRSTKRYPKAIRDCLEVAGDLTNTQKKLGPFSEIATELEDNLLQGKLSISKEGDVQFAVGRGKKIPIQMTASIVKTLSSFIIYLKHLAKSGDLVVIDEPEMNLHPDCQILLTRIFARLANHGLRFLISTHSDYIVREFGALLMLSSPRKAVTKIAKELGYSEEEALEKEDFSAYTFFLRPNNKVYTRKLEVFDNGISVEKMDDAISEQNTRIESLFEELRYGSDDV